MLTYATVEDFLEMKDAGRSGVIVVNDSSKEKIKDYLIKSTRYIQRMTRRDFFPWIETRRYSIPYAAYDLSIRRFPSAHLKLDQDLLEVINVNNGVQDLTADDYFTLEHNVYPKTILAVRFPNYWGGLFGGTQPYKRYDEPIVDVTGIWGYQDYQYPYYAWPNTNSLVTSTGGISDTDTSIEVSDVDTLDELGEEPFVVGRLIRIDNEFMEVTDKNSGSNTISVIRGVRGSTAATHDEGTEIQRWRVVEDISSACLQIAKIWRSSDISAGGRIGVADSSSSTEVAVPADPLAIVKSYQRSLLYG